MAIGAVLDWYKETMMAQPKAVRAAFFPFVFAAVSIIFQIYPPSSANEKVLYTVILCGLALITIYNQYLEIATFEKCKIETAEAILEKDYWADMTNDAMRLGNLFSEMVEMKSELWVEATKMAEQDPKRAINYVRTSNNLHAHLNRLITHVVYGALQRFTNARNHDSIRVAYFVPTQDNSALQVTSINSQRAMPRKRSIAMGEGVASYVWQRPSDEPYFIHDVRKHVDELADNSHFVYFHEGQKETIRSLFAFRVSDGATNACLGVVCIDSNVPNIFFEQVSEATCKHIAKAARARIVYETRFSLMKEALGPY